MSSVTSADGTTIAFDRVGDGPAVILVPGALQFRAADPRLRAFADLLAAAGFSVLSYDRRGRGESSDTRPYVAAREVEDLAALVATVGQPAHLFGMSSGAVLALDAAARGVDVGKLALYEPPFRLTGAAAVPEDYRQELDGLLAEDRRGDAVALFMTAVAGVPQEYVAGMKTEPFWPPFEAVAHTLSYDAALMEGTMNGEALPRDRWRAASGPVLAIAGGASPEHQRDAVKSLAETMTAGRVLIVDGQTHAFDPDVLAPLVSEFLRQ
jgi:pimeloyl-ACP methyl ester carboxylesterase